MSSGAFLSGNNSLPNVTIKNPQNADVLTFDVGSSGWINHQPQNTETDVVTSGTGLFQSGFGTSLSPLVFTPPSVYMGDGTTITRSTPFSTISPLNSKGGLLTNNGSVITQLSPGSNGQVLTAQSGQPDGLQWASTTSYSGDGTTISSSSPFSVIWPLTTKGGLMTYNGTSISQLNPGSNGQVLTAESGQPDGLQWTSTAIYSGDGSTISSSSPFSVIWPLTTKGGLMTYNGTSVVQLTPGSNGQLLASESAQADGLEWITIPTYSGDGTTISSSAPFSSLQHGDGTSITSSSPFSVIWPLTTKGDILVSNGTTSVRFPVGTNGQVLTAESGQPDGIQWVSTATYSGDGTTITTSSPFSAIYPLTTKGDLFTFGSSAARLPVGSNTQVLTADSTQTDGVKWATPSITLATSQNAGPTNQQLSGTGTAASPLFFQFPTTGVGDMLYQNSGNQLDRIPFGIPRQILSIQAGNNTPIWLYPGGGDVIVPSYEPASTYVTTTNATPTSLASYVTASNMIYGLHGWVTAGSSAFGSALFQFTARYTNNAGTLALIGTPVIVVDPITSGWNISFGTSGTSIVVNAVGLFSQTINWKCYIQAFGVPS